MTSMRESLSWACDLVCALIQPRLSMRAAMAFFRLATRPSMSFFDDAGKYLATYSRPRASPSAPSTSSTPRFQRGRWLGVPASAFSLNSKLLSTKRLDRNGAAELTVWNVCQALSVDRGVCV